MRLRHYSKMSANTIGIVMPWVFEFGWYRGPGSSHCRDGYFFVLFCAENPVPVSEGECSAGNIALLD